MDKEKLITKVGIIANNAKKITFDVSNKTIETVTTTKDKVVTKFDKDSNGQVISQEDIIKILDGVYDNVLNGLGMASPSVEDFAKEYLEKASSTNVAAKNMIKNQILKCTTSGFITGFGGLITLPIAIPANIGSVLYVQMRMIACTAYLAGYDLKSDYVQTLVYACLAGVSVNEIFKQAGVKVGVKMARGAITKIPGKTLTKINQKVGFRFITKFGEKGVINLGKLLPGVGAVISGGMDYTETRIIGKRAYKWFFRGDFEEETIKLSKSSSDEKII